MLFTSFMDSERNSKRNNFLKHIYNLWELGQSSKWLNVRKKSQQMPVQKAN